MSRPTQVRTGWSRDLQGVNQATYKPKAREDELGSVVEIEE
jgi:hypothetical protein